MRGNEMWRAVMRLAAAQHGVISRAQARALGLTSKVLQQGLDDGLLVAVTPRVLRVAGAPGSDRQAAMVGVLDAGGGAVVAQVAAAALWGLPGFDLRRIDLLRPRGRTSRRPHRARVHETRWLPPTHVTTIDGIPVTTVARTMFDLAGCVHPKRAERALENALNRKLTDLPKVRTVASELLERGREGTVLMAQLLQERTGDYVATASGLEGAFLDLVDLADLPPPVRQLDAGGDHWIGRVDFAWRERRLLVEVDSDLHHTGKLDVERDARRDTDLRAAGFRVARFTEDEVKARSPSAARRLRDFFDGA